MRILFDSQKTEYKSPFGTLTPGESCTLHLHIPTSVPTVAAECIFCWEDGSFAFSASLDFLRRDGLYAIYKGVFSIEKPGLYFYHFRIHKADGSFRLFKQGHDTNMEEGDCWQISCIPASFTTPAWAKGAVIYQIFPDRFHKAGACDLTGKLIPYTLHKDWNEEVAWEPDEQGRVLNNDFFGGNFRGITEKLDYIASFGVNIIYLNPICKSFSSHRYDTGDYKTPDPMLGTEADFSALCQAAHARGIRVILDGVFSHTGADSLYFDKYGHFGGKGAYCDESSPYRSWYQFYDYPDSYNSWWGFDTLPTVNKLDSGFMDYIIDSEDSVVAHWLKLGADGFRLDVVDELPDSFVLRLKNRIRALRPDVLLIGEVWEDASNKIAYNVRRRYFVDGELDSCMNYPFRTAILDFMRSRDDGRVFGERIMTVLENYPPQVIACNMNLLGTHDTPRILTALVDDFDGSRQALARRKLSPNQRKVAEALLEMAAFLQFTLPGAPSIYYGDEAGMEGGKDPFNRRTYPWGRENKTLISLYQQLGKLRSTQPALREGTLSFSYAADGLIHFTRQLGPTTLHIYVNRSHDPWEVSSAPVLLGRHILRQSPGLLELAPMGFCITKEEKDGN